MDVSKGEGFGYVPKEKSLFLPLPSQAPTLYEDGAWLDAATNAKLGERLTLCLNEDRHSPITLAAVYPHRCGTQTQMARQIREANRKDKSKNDEIANRKKVIDNGDGLFYYHSLSQIDNTHFPSPTLNSYPTYPTPFSNPHLPPTRPRTPRSN